MGEIAGLVSGSAPAMHSATRETSTYPLTRAMGQSLSQKLKMSVQHAFEDAGLLTKDGKLTEKAALRSEICSLKGGVTADGPIGKRVDERWVGCS